MKKVLFGLLALSSLGFAKEAVPAPAKLSEPSAPTYVATVVAPVSASYLTLRFGGDIAPRYDRADFGYNPNFLVPDSGIGATFEESGLFSKSLNDKDAGFGFEIAAEYMYPIQQLPGFELGLGVAFQRHGKLDSVNHSVTLFNTVDVGRVDLRTEREIPSFDSLPLYVVGKYKFDNWDMWGTGAKFYLKGDLGWSYNMERGDTRSNISLYLTDFTDFAEIDASLIGNSKIKNGVYWGVGFGVEYTNWTVDLMYKVNTAKIEGDYSVPFGVSSSLGSLDSKVASFSDSLDYSRIALSVGYKF